MSPADLGRSSKTGAAITAPGRPQQRPTGGTVAANSKTVNPDSRKALNRGGILGVRPAGAGECRRILESLRRDDARWARECRHGEVLALRLHGGLLLAGEADLFVGE